MAAWRGEWGSGRSEESIGRLECEEKTKRLQWHITVLGECAVTALERREGGESIGGREVEEG
jgi:hypothetical protein